VTLQFIQVTICPLPSFLFELDSHFMSPWPRRLYITDLIIEVEEVTIIILYLVFWCTYFDSSVRNMITKITSTSVTKCNHSRIMGSVKGSQ